MSVARQLVSAGASLSIDKAYRVSLVLHPILPIITLSFWASRASRPVAKVGVA